MLSRFFGQSPQQHVFTSLRFVLNDNTNVGIRFPPAPAFSSPTNYYYPISGPHPVYLDSCFPAWEQSGHTCIVLKRRYPRLTEMTELHFLHMYSGDTPCPVALDGDTEIGLIEEGGGAADVVHGRDGELLGQRVTFHLGGVGG